MNVFSNLKTHTRAIFVSIVDNSWFLFSITYFRKDVIRSRMASLFNILESFITPLYRIPKTHFFQKIK
jgi:hypothetical protein